MYVPCHECANRRGFAYTKDCDSTCSYASIVKCRNDYIDELEAKLRKTEDLLEKAYYIIGQVVDKPNPFEQKKTESSDLIRMMRNGILPSLQHNEED